MSSNQLQKVVMRRVYYSYALSFFSQVVFWQGVFLGASAMLLGNWLHVASIINNFLAVPVGRVPSYVLEVILKVLAEGQVLALAILILAGLTALSAGYHLVKPLSFRSNTFFKTS
jgi:hypothetical protein